MSEIKFSCPNCGQSITADERRVGQQVQCPTCKKNFAVPSGMRAQPTPPPVVAAVATPPPDATLKAPERRMSGFAVLSFCLALITLPLNTLSRIIHFPVGLLGCIPAVICGHLALKQIRSQSNMGGRGFALAGLIIGYIAVALGFISLSYLIVHPHGTLSTRASAFSSGQTQPAESPVATDPNTANIPSEPVTGTVEKLPFTVKEADINTGVLHLQDAAKNPDIEVLVFLFLKGDETIAGLKRIVPGTATIPHIHLRWKEGDTRRSLALTRGYAMRLEFEERTGNMVHGKIYLELPASYGTKLAGTFEARVK